MILWLNGAFGVGKTTTARELARCLPGARIFDPELVGRMLRALITEPIDPTGGFAPRPAGKAGRVPTPRLASLDDDFQDWPAWRALVAETALELRRHDRSTVIAPMTLLRHDHATEIFSRFAARGARVPAHRAARGDGRADAANRHRSR